MIYVAITVLHESMHGIAHRRRRLDTALGRLAGLPLMLPLPLCRAAHLAHHAHTIDPELGPYMMATKRPACPRPLWFLWTPIHYRVVVYGQGLIRDRVARVEALHTDGLIVLATFAMGASGNGLLLLQIWVIPAVLAIPWLVLAFDLRTTIPWYHDHDTYREVEADLLARELIHDPAYVHP